MWVAISGTTELVRLMRRHPLDVPNGRYRLGDKILFPLPPEIRGLGITGDGFGEAYAKSQAASGIRLPTRGVCLISVRDRDKEGAIAIARRLAERGFEIIATSGAMST